MEKHTRQGNTEQPSVEERNPDNTGSVIGAARMDPEEAYGAIPPLLQDHINNASEDAWLEIKQRIDNIVISVGCSLESLDLKAPFSEELIKRVANGQKLFFKPNLVTLPTIDFKTHGLSNAGSCTPWEFVAALMRWFHDNLDISYHMMSLGESGTNVSVTAAAATNLFGRGAVTTLALMEGKYGDNYGGWGFYFVRKYLAETHNPSHSDDPMEGYAESLEGVCLPPGKANNKLLLYDINKTGNNGCDGREVPVANGVNFYSITLHKGVIGGDPNDSADIRDWPGSVLINVPKLKIHQLELLTCAVKNLGVGLYPMESNGSGKQGKINWQYARPNLPVPSFKVKLPHRRWAVDFDEKTGMPVRNEDGGYVMTRTGGMEATMADAIQAVKGQDIFMLHVADAIESTNIAHTGPACTPVPEGFVFASTDPVALDEMALRYMFNTVPSNETEKVRKDNHLTSDVIQKIPLTEIDGDNIITVEGFDSPYSRYHALQHCEERGLGRREFQVTGKDLWRGGNLASQGHRLGRIENGAFTELFPTAMYHTAMSLLWYNQAGSISYLKANDKLTGSGYEKKILDAYDENGDGVIDFLERGKSTLYGMMPFGALLGTLDIEPEKVLKLRFLLNIVPLRLLKKEWNPDGHCIGEDNLIANAVAHSFIMSKADKEIPDSFFPGMKWGRGKWPSLQFSIHRQLAKSLYGPAFPELISVLMSPYGQAFRYADAKWNGAEYCTSEALSKNEDIVSGYHKALETGAQPLPFVFYVPEGFSMIGSAQIPNVKETADLSLIFTAVFDGKEVWDNLDLTGLC